MLTCNKNINIKSFYMKGFINSQFKNTSLEPQPIKLSTSQMGQTSENHESNKNAQFLTFQEYHNNKNYGHRDNIQNHQEEPVQNDSRIQNQCNQQEIDMENEDPLRMIIQYRQKIHKMSENIIKLEEKSYYFEDFNRKLLKELQQLRQRQQKYKIQAQVLHKQLNSCQQKLIKQKQIIQQYERKFQQQQKMKFSLKGFQEKLQIKENTIRQLNKRNSQMFKIHQNLELDIKMASDRIIYLQKQLQSKVYAEFCNNLGRTKTLKQNPFSSLLPQRLSFPRKLHQRCLKTQPNQNTYSNTKPKRY